MTQAEPLTRTQTLTSALRSVRKGLEKLGDNQIGTLQKVHAFRSCILSRSSGVYKD